MNNTAPTSPDEAITAGDLLRSIAKTNLGEVSPIDSEALYRHKFTQDAIQQEYAYVHLTGIQEHYKHKSWWSWFLMALIGVIIIFQLVLITLVGLQLFDFTKYEWLVQLLLVQNLAQVVGLAVYAVKYLFSDISHQKSTLM